MNIVEPIINSCREAVQPFIESSLLKGVLASVGLSAGFLFGVEFYEFIWIIIILVVLDSVTGVWGAKVAGHVISSKKFITTVPKMLRYLVFIIAAHMLQEAISLEMYIENIVIVFLATTEFISIAENLGKAGMPVPKALLNKVHELRGKQ